MCYRDLTCNVEILVWWYIINLWKRKEKKDILPFELSKKKNQQVPLRIFSYALDLFEFGLWQQWFDNLSYWFD